MFSATYFTYDGVNSATYGLKIASINGEYIRTTKAFAPTLNIAKGIKSKKFFYSGIDYADSPEYQFTILSDCEINSNQRRTILRWLVGRKQFKKLTLAEESYTNIHFYCIFKTVDLVFVGGECRGFVLTAKFDSPYCYGEPESYVIENDKLGVDISIPNNTDIVDDYVYPTIVFRNTHSSNAVTLKITNKSDGSRVTSYENIKVNEQIIIDGELKLINSTIGGDQLSHFNKHWLRFRRDIQATDTETGQVYKTNNNKINITVEGYGGATIDGANFSVTIKVPQYILLGF